MANFLMVADPDPDRRARFCRLAGPDLALLDGLEAGECAVGDFAAMWASGKRAPISRTTDGSRAAVIWGRALANDGRPVAAAELPALWTDVARSMPSAFDGYHAAVSYDPQSGMTVGADILGMYPVFWWSDGTVHLVGSSPDPFRLHPRFRWSLDRTGLAGILLSTHHIGGRTLMDSVRRLRPGHLLVAAPNAPLREVQQYELPISTDHFDLPHSRAVEMLYETLAAAVARHVPAGATLALSGGRDSRLLAGLMAQSGRPFDSFTFGEEGDFELRCASGVARVLGIRHQRLPVNFDAECIALQTRALHCSTGYSGVSYWHARTALESVGPYLVNGYTMDSVVGGSNMIWPYDRGTGKVSFSTHLSRVNSHGVPLPQMAKLLKREAWSGVLEQVTNEIESTYESYASSASQRAWGFALHHRQRLNIGNPPWVLSFGAWPILPVVDKQVLKIAGGLPAAVLTERRAQDDVIRSYFPALAELPLDRAGLDMTPLTLRIRQRLARNFLAKIEPVTRRLRSGRGPERRYYHRLYDFNGSAWKAARYQAEPSRRKLYELFDEPALGEALPPPDADVEVANSIAGTHGMKMLVGLCLWAERYL